MSDSSNAPVAAAPAAPKLADVRPAVPNRRWITAALMLVMVMASLEATVTSTAMYTIIGELKGLEHYSWVASIYLLASTVVMPLYGRLADVLGRKRVMMFSLLMFTLGSVCAAFSHSMLQLIIFRGLQGLGAGGIMPVVLTILGDIFTIEERARIQGLFSAVWGTSALAGPALGELLVETLGWRSIFWVNLPAGFIGIIVLSWTYHDRQKPHSTSLDLPGLIMLSLGSTALLGGVSLLAGVTVAMWVPYVLLAVAAVCLVTFVRLEQRAENPIMPPKLFVQRTIGPSMVVSGLLGVGVFALDTYVPLYVQGGMGGSVRAAAVSVSPVMFAWALSGIVAAKLLIRWSFRVTCVIGALLVITGFAGLLLCALFGAPLWVLTAVLFITGFGFGPCSMACLLAAQDAVAWQQRGIITSGITFYRNLGGALGVAILGSLFNIFTAAKLGALSNGQFHPADLTNHSKMEELQKSHPEILLQARETISHGLLWVFIGMFVAAILQLVFARMIRAHKHPTPITTAEALASVE